MRAARICSMIGLTALLGLGGCERAAALAEMGRNFFTGQEAAAPGTTGACTTEPAGAADESCRSGGPVPVSESSATVVRTPLYCYRTLAAITCYDSPDPLAGPGQRVQ